MRLKTESEKVTIATVRNLNQLGMLFINKTTISKNMN